MSDGRPAEKRRDRADGQSLKRAVLGAGAWLEQQADAVNALNVFPVPDGDTGTNMSLTMRATAGSVANSAERHVGRIAASMAHGALMGARGNSGVILSQIIRGFARAIEGVGILDGPALAAALEGATKMAYQGVGKPVEGTILTVCRMASEAARASVDVGGSLEDVLYAATIAAREAVANTPNQLAVLKEAGVVDAGGQGLFLLMEGALRTLRGEELPAAAVAAVQAVSAAPGEEQTYGYCTEFLVAGKQLDADAMRDELGRLGDSLLVVGDDRLVRVHVHTFEPGKAIAVGTAAGILRLV
jgi:DAK2 domain fusion protein YloV